MKPVVNAGSGHVGSIGKITAWPLEAYYETAVS